jgi:hypothetical protein
MSGVKRIEGRAGTKPEGKAGIKPEGKVGTRPEGRARDTKPAPIRTRPPKPGPSITPKKGNAIGVDADLAKAIEVARSHRAELEAKPDVIDVRGGYKFKDGRITDTAAVVVVVKRKRNDLSAAAGVPASIDGVPTDVAVADPLELLNAGGAGEAFALGVEENRLLIDDLQRDSADSVVEAVPQITYEPPPDGDLSPVTEAMTVLCHVSPDAGWSVLEPFLAETESELSLGMYDFTAPHIYRTARTVLKKPGVDWHQTLGPNESLPTDDDVDSTKAGDIPEEKIVAGLKRVGGKRFKSAFAHVGAGKTFASAYHIKVAVRDKRAFWLSSGNWQSSNQPAVDFLDPDSDRTVIPRYNREWHVVVENETLAKRFRVYLEHDRADASRELQEAAVAPRPDLLIPIEEFFLEEKARLDLDVFPPQKFTFSADEPLTVQPILTPDNYVDIVQKLLNEKPKKSLYFQNQSLNPVKAPTREFEEMMGRLIDYSNDPDLDVRLIFRNIGPVRKKLESLKAVGFNMKCIRMQAGCHTKGIIVDSKTVLLGSHNFTNQGVQVNRDASLLIQNSAIARYYERIFLHDWERLARETIREELAAIPIGALEAGAVTNGGYVRVSASYFDED